MASAPQTTVSNTQGVAFAGMVADNSLLKDCKSYLSAESSAEIAFGTAVVQGTTEIECLKPAAQANLILGVVAHSHDYQKDVELGTTGLKPKATVTPLTRGRIWVVVTEAVTFTDAVRVNMSGADAGKFGKTSSGGVTKLITGAARWLSTTTGAGVAQLEIDINNRSAWTND